MKNLIKMKMRTIHFKIMLSRFFLFLLLIFSSHLKATQLLVPMDESQTNHLKAYGLAFWTLENSITIEWLLNYRGGSFLMPHLKTIE